MTVSRDTMDQFARRLGEHTRSHDLDLVDVVFHASEPLLVGADFIDYAARTIRRAVSHGTVVRLSVQTNGVMLDERILPTLLAHDIHVSVSLDGGAQDRHRRYQRYAHLFVTLLCTIDIRNDPIEVYEALAAAAPPGIDFLLPHGNWDTPPPQRATDPTETWYDAPVREVRVRL